MVTYDKFMKWLEATLDTAITRSETKHSVGVTESKLEEHKVNRAHNKYIKLLCHFEIGKINHWLPHWKCTNSKFVLPN